MKLVKTLGFILSVAGAVIGIAGECVDRKENEIFIKEEVNRQLNERVKNEEES